MKLIEQSKGTIDRLVNDFFERAQRLDEEFCFPDQNLDELIKCGLHVANMPKQSGGLGYGFQETVKLLARISSGCPSTGLVMAMHYYSLGAFSEVLTNEQQSVVFQDICDSGEMIASVSDPNVLFIYHRKQMEGIPTITAEKTSGGYLVSGTKFTVTGAPRIKYLPIYCQYAPVTCASQYGMTALLVTLPTEGVTIEESWNYSGMKASMSHHIHFDQAFVPDHHLIGREGYAIEDTEDLIYWFRLAVTAVYYGIAKTAYRHAVQVSHQKKDRISKKNTAFLPGQQFRIADMKIKLDMAHSQLMSCAQQADEEKTQGAFSSDLYTRTLITKHVVTKAAEEIVQLASQVEGFTALQNGSLLERLGRDVKAAKFHPPSEDVLKEVIAKKELGIIPLKNRWG
ncbi:acyl-CoA dehydrogenase family protein [Bacillus sp. NPDC077027]|uniref:acyl-CoA dehydrogenase family protein n=1 Tax=Bacillus sp. NPDC077027 TaxID=3390548 RepID=UPI003D02070F